MWIWINFYCSLQFIPMHTTQLRKENVWEMTLLSRFHRIITKNIKEEIRLLVELNLPRNFISILLRIEKFQSLELLLLTNTCFRRIIRIAFEIGSWRKIWLRKRKKANLRSINSKLVLFLNPIVKKNIRSLWPTSMKKRRDWDKRNCCNTNNMKKR